MRARILVAVACGLLATPARAADEAAVLRLRAEELAAQGRCDEALPRAQRARQLAPDDARVALVIGRCALRSGNFREAIEPLEAARRLDPSIPGLDSDLAQAHYHLDQLDRAEQELDRALERDPDDARALLYRGLVLLRRAENASAAEVLDRASRLDRRVSPAASFYAGLAWEYARDRDRAVESLERARSADPQSEWAQAAERALERLGEPYRRHNWALLRGGLEYDTNVPLQARDPGPGFLAQPLNVRKGDGRAVFDGELGVELLRNPEWSAGAIAGYDGSAQFDLHRFDLQYPWLSLWLDHRLGDKTWLRLEPFGGYQWLETDPFLIHGGAQLSLDRELAEALIGRAFVRYNYNDFRYRIPDDPTLTSPQFMALFPTLWAPANARAKRARNRDGGQLDVGGELEYRLAATETALSGRVAYERYDSKGRDWRYNGVVARVGLEQDLPLRFTLEGFASYAHLQFQWYSSFLPVNKFLLGDGPKRRDDVWDLGASLERPITDYAKLSVNYSYTNNVSNTHVYNYRRQIVGGYLTLTWAD